MQLLKRLQSEGHEIFVVANRDNYSTLLEKEGFKYFEIKVSNNSKNPFSDLILIYNYYKIYKKIRPDVILHNAIKPNIYGTLAAGMLKIRTINNISGLGTLFIKHSFSTKIAKLLYRISQKFATKVFFQNPEDKQLFISQRLVTTSKSYLLPGSGVDSNFLSPSNFPKQKSETFRFLFIGRLLKDKGIIEYFEAAKNIIITEKYPNCSFNILGPLYEQNETGIGKIELENFLIPNKIIYLGETDNIGEELAKCDCLVLPSYREGLSKVLIEASSMGLPIITTNVPGCKHVVTQDLNGFLCEPKNIKSLEKAMIKMLDMTELQRSEMGTKGREIAINKFDVQIVIAEYMEALNQINKTIQHAD